VRAVLVYAGVALLYLFLPVLVVLVFSFNHPAGRFNFSWQGFTLDNWLHPCAVPGMCSSVGLSLEIGALATLGSVLLGTLIAFALVRHRFRGRDATNLLAFSLSFDDFIITNFNAGPATVTFPMFVWGAAQRGIPPQINVIGGVMFIVPLLLALAGQAITRSRER
jgi:ABC-type spermidine/putrescine transport system permease subunit II